jgi:6-phosphogluconolactonase
MPHCASGSGWVLAVHEPRVQPPDRITLTLPALNSAAHIYFLVTGAEKAPAVRRVIQPAEGEAPLPAALVQPAHGDVTWILDAAAAHDLQPPDATATGTWPRPLPDPPASSGG